LILLSLWYWVGLGLDYGTFKLTGFDYVQLVPHWLRWGVFSLIAITLFTLVTLKLVRLARTFRDESLALVLERRFPKLLGDRLITAVELTDLDDAEAPWLLAVDDPQDRGRREPPGRSPPDPRRVQLGPREVAIRAPGGSVGGAVLWRDGRKTLSPTVRRTRSTSLTGSGTGRASGSSATSCSGTRFGRDGRTWNWSISRLGRPADRAATHRRAESGRGAEVGDRRPRGPGRVAGVDLGRSDPEATERPPGAALPTALLVAPAQSKDAPAATDPYWTLDRVEMLLDTSEVRERLLKSGLSEPTTPPCAIPSTR